jgi:imidazolonepropionase-like amidohydrolase
MSKLMIVGPVILALGASAIGQDSETPSMEIYFGNRPTEYKVAKWGPESIPSPAYALKAAKILPITGAPITNGVILTLNSKIIALGPQSEITIPENYEVIDFGRHWIVPGLVDLHSHVPYILNDSVHASNPEMRTLDQITLDHPTLKAALTGGITTVLLIPGSGSNMGGFGTLTKIAGSSPEEALIRFPGSLKIAQAGNPERRSGDLGSSRMGMNQGLRFTLERGRQYYQAWEDFDAGMAPKPEFQADLENLRGVFRHEFPVSVHTQQYQVALETIRELRQEFGLWTFIDHGTFDAYRLSEEAALAGVPVCNGPRQYLFDLDTSRIIGLADAWYRGGQHGWREPVRGVGRDGIAINTDATPSGGIRQEHLTLQVAVAVRLGLPDEVGLMGITINPARFVGIDHRVGSLEVGKDADLGVWSGDPIDPRSYVEAVMINGKIVHRRNKDRPKF